MNTRSSTKAEMVAADEIISIMIWTQLFLEAQGYPVKQNILYQDNKSAMLLETNGCKSAGKHSHHLNIQYFYIADQKAKGHIDIKYCLTDEMIRDYMTKPLHQAKFNGFHQQIMHLPVAAQLIMAANRKNPKALNKVTKCHTMMVQAGFSSTFVLCLYYVCAIYGIMFFFLLS